jgi:hypothetical protein
VILIDLLTMMGWDYVSELWPPTGLLFIPWVICEHGQPWRWCCRLEITPDSSTRELSGSPTSRHLVASKRNGQMSENFAYQYLRYLKGSLTYLEILRHGTSVFTSHLKEGVLWIFIALKNPLPQPGFNLQPLGPVAITLTTTSLSQLWRDRHSL